METKENVIIDLHAPEIQKSLIDVMNYLYTLLAEKNKKGNGHDNSSDIQQRLAG